MTTNRYRVQTHTGAGRGGWAVTIVDPQGAAVFERPCGSEEEARTFASTVEQHIAWLSEEKFRRYYRLAEPVADGG